MPVCPTGAADGAVTQENRPPVPMPVRPTGSLDREPSLTVESGKRACGECARAGVKEDTGCRDLEKPMPVCPIGNADGDSRLEVESGTRVCGKCARVKVSVARRRGLKTLMPVCPTCGMDGSRKRRCVMRTQVYETSLQPNGMRRRFDRCGSPGLPETGGFEDGQCRYDLRG